jgi:hypothetical protein
MVLNVQLIMLRASSPQLLIRVLQAIRKGFAQRRDVGRVLRCLQSFALRPDLTTMEELHIVVIASERVLGHCAVPVL